MRSRHLLAMFVAALIVSFAGSADAGGKPDGATCHVSKSCKSKYCVTIKPLDKFGKCCSPSNCPALNAQCGSIDNGCGVPITCGGCGAGFDCVQNKCVATSTTTTSTTSSTTTSSTTTTTAGPPQSTTTTIPPNPDSCQGQCGGQAPSGCYCDYDSCTFGDGCADRDTACPVQCQARSCQGYCYAINVPPPGGFPANDCYCDTLSCEFGDGCPDRDSACPGICAPPPSTSTTVPAPTTTTTSTTLF